MTRADAVAQLMSGETSGGAPRYLNYLYGFALEAICLLDAELAV